MSPSFEEKFGQEELVKELGQIQRGKDQRE